MRPRISITYKLALLITALITVGMITLGSLVVTNQSRVMYEQMYTLGRLITAQVAESSIEMLLAGDKLGLEVIANNTAKHDEVLGVTVYSDELKGVAMSGEQIPLPALEPGGELQRFETTVNKVRYLSLVRPIQFRDVVAGYLQLNFDLSRLEQAIHRSIRDIVITTAVMILLGLVAAFILGKRLTRPIFTLIQASQQIGEGRYDITLPKRSDEIGQLMESLNRMAAGLKRKEEVENAFIRYMSPNVAGEVLGKLGQLRLGGSFVNASVLFADIVGFTSLSEGMTPQAVSELLNDYFSRIAESATAFGGHVDKYIGDCAMMVFGLPPGKEHHSYSALAAALLLREVVAQLGEQRSRLGLTTVQFRIGVNAGDMVAGNLGSSERMEYTVIGDSVNLASRLSHASEPNQIIVTEEMLNIPELAGRVEAIRHCSIKLRGKAEEVTLYRVEGLKDLSSEMIAAMATRLIEKREKQQA